jgi:ribonuclease P protein component
VVAALEMLRSAADFGRIQSQSRSRAHPLLLMRYRRNGLESTRYGISTGRRVGSAVVRNGVRRRLRTVLRAVDPQVEPGWDILLVARPAAAGVKQRELDAALRQLLRGAGVELTDPAPTREVEG